MTNEPKFSENEIIAHGHSSEYGGFCKLCFEQGEQAEKAEERKYSGNHFHNHESECVFCIEKGRQAGNMELVADHHNKTCEKCEELKQAGIKEGWDGKDKLGTKDCCPKPPTNECSCYYLGKEEGRQLEREEHDCKVEEDIHKAIHETRLDTIVEVEKIIINCHNPAENYCCVPDILKKLKEKNEG